MGIMDTIMGWFGIGQPKVTATLDKDTVGPGGLVTATVTLEGGSRPVPVTAIEIYFKKESPLGEDGGKTWDTLVEERIWLGDQVLEQGDTMEASLTFQVPTDIEPTEGEISYEVDCSAAVPGWDPEVELELTVTDTPDPMAAEDYSEYHVLPAQRSFRHSSVRGDFRVIPFEDGVVLQWKDALVCRSADGEERWRSPSGRTATVSPDGTRIAAANGSKQVQILNLDTGELDVLMTLDGYVNNIVWTSEGLALNLTDAVVIVDMEGNELRRVTSFGGDGDIFCGSLAGHGDTLFAIDSNDRLLVTIDATSGDVGKTTELSFYPSDVYAVRAGGETVLVLDSDDEVAFFDPGLDSLGDLVVPGKKGIRYLGQEEHSSTHHKVCGRLSPSGEHVLVNDESGMLWLLSRSGDPIRTWPRGEAIDFVEDTGWLDDDTFVAITNDGKSHRVRLQDGGIDWTQQDV